MWGFDSVFIYSFTFHANSHKSRTFPSRILDFVEIMNVETSVEDIGPYKVLQLFCKYLTYFRLLI